MLRRFFPCLAALLCSPAIWSQNLPGMAAGVLNETELARRAVAARDKADAMDHLRKAEILTGEIQKQSPENSQPLMVPVRRDIETTTTYTPVKQKHGEMTASRLKKNTSIREVDGEVATSNLNVTAVAEKLPAVESALQRDDWATADTVLAGIANSVVTTQAEGDMPLLKVRQNLQLARARVLDAKYKDAVVPLRAAAEGLHAFAEQAPGPNAERAESMRQEILDYAAHIGRDPSDAQVKIDYWMGPVDEWYRKVVH